MTVRCIAFDLNDTLYLERDYIRTGFLAAGLLVEELTEKTLPLTRRAFDHPSTPGLWVFSLTLGGRPGSSLRDPLTIPHTGSKLLATEAPAKTN